MFFTGGALRFHKVGNPKVLPGSPESCTAEQQLADLPEGTKCRTLLVSIAERAVANARFLSPAASNLPPPHQSTHHGCVIPALMSERSPLLSPAAVFLTARRHMQ